MPHWRPEAEEELARYLTAVAELCRHKGDDAEEIVADLRAHIQEEVERGAEGEVRLGDLEPILRRLGSPAQVAGTEGGTPEAAPGAAPAFEAVPEGSWGLVDRILRDRPALYSRLRGEGNLRGLCGRLTLIFVLSTALYGLAMGSFRWIHPQYFFSDYELRIDGRQPLRGEVLGLDPDENSVYVGETAFAQDRMTGRATIRFNLTDPSEPLEIRRLDIQKGYGRIVLSGSGALGEEGAWRLPLLVAAKAPSLFLMTLLLCLPALYVLNLTFGFHLRLGPTLTLSLFALAATGILLAVFVPIVALFSLVTSSYHFTKLMHMLVFGVAGGFGVKVLWEGLNLLAHQHSVRIRSLFAAWLLLYCLVGGQCTWTLKPWIGTPYLPATPPFRIDRGNIYVSAFESLERMLHGRNSRAREEGRE